jgi:hypothetical protein
MDQIITVPRVLLWYLQMLVAPDIRAMGVVHDTWTVSASLVSPPQTIVAIMFWVLVLSATFRFRSARPWIGFGIWWFAAGHSLEAAPIGLDLAYEHRNYLPVAGPILALVVAAAAGVERYAIRRTAAAAILAAIVLVISFLTVLRVNEWRDITRWSYAQFEHHPTSAASAYFLGGLLATFAEKEQEATARDAWFAKADDLFARSAALNAAGTHAVIARLLLRESLGKETSEELYEDVVRRLSHGRLDASAQSALTSWIGCSIKKECATPEDRLLLVVNAALENPLCKGIMSSRLLSLLAEYYGEARNEPRKAATFAKAATEVRGGDVVSWFTLIKWLARLGYLTQAMEALDEVDRRDSKEALTQVRARVREDLRALLEAAEPATEP